MYTTLYPHTNIIIHSYTLPVHGLMGGKKDTKVNLFVVYILIQGSI